jgi:uncharacterized protein YdhG (YjbR/CyaY superfamily)
MNSWDNYLDNLDKPRKQLVVSVLEMAKKYSTDAIEEMPYGVPGLKLNGKPLIAIAAHKQHYGIYPFSPKVIKAAMYLIGNRKTSEGTIRFDYTDFPDEELIKELIELRSQEITKNN